MLFNIMIYTLKQFNTSKVHNKLILVTLLIVSTPFLILSKLAQNNFIITRYKFNGVNVGVYGITLSVLFANYSSFFLYTK